MLSTHGFGGGEAWRACDEAWDVYDKAYNVYREIYKKHLPLIEKLHQEECLDCPWDGNTIFPKAKPEVKND